MFLLTDAPTTSNRYYARDLPLPTPVLDSVRALQESTATWRRCFGSIDILGANLTAEQDVYNPGGDGVDWNTGPNMQFYRIVNYLTVHGGAYDVFFYMEGDTVPRKAGWLDALREAVVEYTPFSVLGSTYSGHNWDSYLNVFPPVIPPTLR